MTMLEGVPAGSIGEVAQLGDEWSFTLYDTDEREIVAFVFVEEGRACSSAPWPS
jgi:hypothetical protein